MNLKYQLIFIVIFVVKFAQSEEFLLPNTTRPLRYELMITTSVPDASEQFTGVISISIEVLEDTNEIFLNSRHQEINECKLYDDNGIEIEEGITCERENEDVIVINSAQKLIEGSKYELQLSYQGSLQITSEGFFGSEYATRASGVDVFT